MLQNMMSDQGLGCSVCWVCEFVIYLFVYSPTQGLYLYIVMNKVVPISEFVVFFLTHFRLNNPVPRSPPQPQLHVYTERAEFQFKLCSAMWFRFSWRKMAVLFASSGDLIKYHSLYCLSITLFGVSRWKWVKWWVLNRLTVNVQNFDHFIQSFFFFFLNINFAFYAVPSLNT